MKALTLVMMLALPQQRNEAPPTPQLVVTGNAQILVAPDEATVRLGIVRQASTAQAAQDQVNTVAREILNAIEKTGVPKAQIQTSRLMLNPVYAPRAPEARDAPRIVAYNASNTVSVRLDNLSLVGPVIDAGLKAGANQLEGVHFSLRNEAASKEQALRQAIMQARSKAQAMADALRVTLGEAIEIIEEGATITMPYGIGEGRAPGLMAETVNVATPVSPGEVQVAAGVTIRYRISQKP